MEYDGLVWSPVLDKCGVLPLPTFSSTYSHNWIIFQYFMTWFLNSSYSKQLICTFFLLMCLSRLFSLFSSSRSLLDYSTFYTDSAMWHCNILSTASQPITMMGIGCLMEWSNKISILKRLSCFPKLSMRTSKFFSRNSSINLFSALALCIGTKSPLGSIYINPLAFVTIFTFVELWIKIS